MRKANLVAVTPNPSHLLVHEAQNLALKKFGDRVGKEADVTKLRCMGKEWVKVDSDNTSVLDSGKGSVMDTDEVDSVGKRPVKKGKKAGKAARKAAAAASAVAAAATAATITATAAAAAVTLPEPVVPRGRPSGSVAGIKRAREASTASRASSMRSEFSDGFKVPRTCAAPRGSMMDSTLSMGPGEEFVPKLAQGQLLTGLGRLKTTVFGIVQKINNFELDRVGENWERKKCCLGLDNLRTCANEIRDKLDGTGKSLSCYEKQMGGMPRCLL
jgi:hypothetical protein